MSNNKIDLGKHNVSESIQNKDFQKKEIIIPWENVGETVKALRKEMGISRKKLSELSNIPESTIKRYESGKGINSNSANTILSSLGFILSTQLEERHSNPLDKQITLTDELLHNLLTSMQDIQNILQQFK